MTSKHTDPQSFYSPVDRKNRRWLALALLVITFLVWSISGSILTAIVFMIWPEPRSPWQELLANCVAFLPLFVLLLFLPFALKRGLVTTFTSGRTFRYGLVFWGMWTWGLLLAAESIYKFAVSPSTFKLTLQVAEFLPALLVAMVFVTIQATSEEMLFRSAIPKVVGSFAKNPVVIIGLSSLLFGLPHLSNPEAANQFWVSLLAYSLTGAAWGWISYRSGGIELAIGAHVINNIYGLVLVGYDNSAVTTASIFKTPELDMTQSLIQNAIMLGLWVTWLSKGKLAQTHGGLNKRES